jgi:ligand-binding sensor domain-containing protein
MKSQSTPTHGTTRRLSHFLASGCIFAVQAMKNFSRLRWRYVVILGLVLATISVGIVYRQANLALRVAEQQVRTAGEIPLQLKELATSNSRFEWIDSPLAFSGVAVFKGEFFLAGASGLFEYDNHGTLLKHFRPGLELPPSPLVKIATGTIRGSHEPELFISTETQGLLIFNGTTFRQILPADPAALSITSLLPLSSGQLLVGTRKRGLLVYDGKKLRSFHPQLNTLPVTELAGDDSDLWIGTQDRGVIHFQAGQLKTFGEAEGMPDRQVFSISTRGDSAFVGTAVGIAQFERGQFVRVLAPGAFAHALFAGENSLLVGAHENITTINIQSAGRLSHLRTLTSSIPDVRQMLSNGSTVYAVTSGALYINDGQRSAWRRAFTPPTPLLTDRNISALSMDTSAGGSNRLWVGYFDHGLDLLGPELRSSTHIEDDNVFCVNRILPNPSAGAVAVATANGLVMFDRLGRKQTIVGRREGLLADHVTDAALYGDGMVLATPAGLTFLDGSGPHSLYAFHGLVNNHVYAVAASGKEVVAGTLGGISVLENENVAANYTVASRGLTHNWISAVVRVGDEWFVGTYGGGIVRMSNSGHFDGFDVATGKVEIYPNAMLATPAHVLAGTLGKGLYVFNRSTNHWTVLSEGLPSLTVTALTAGNGYIYVGTDNGLVRIPESNLP